MEHSTAEAVVAKLQTPVVEAAGTGLAEATSVAAIAAFASATSTFDLLEAPNPVLDRMDCTLMGPPNR